MTRIKPSLRGVFWTMAIALGGCAPPPSATPPVEAVAVGFDFSRARLVDLSHGYSEETLYWPTSPSGFELEVLHHGPTPGGYFYSANTLCTPEHGGTHLDAPIHFGEGKWTTEQIPLERLVGPAVVIDVSEATAENPDHRLTTEELMGWEEAHGEIPAGAIVLVRTGWSERWPGAKAYLGDDTPGDASNLHFPSFGEAAARWLIEERGASVLGIDTASIDYGASADFPVHQVAAAANVPGLENLTRLGELPATGAWVLALPMKIERGSGGPTRVVGLVPE